MAKRPALAVLRVDKDPTTGRPILVMPARVDVEALSGLDDGALLEVYEYRPPSKKQEGYLRALWRLGAETHREGAAFKTEDAIKNESKRLAGMFDGFIVRRGQDAQINFKNTPDLTVEELKTLVDVTINFLLEEVLQPGTDIDALREEAKTRSTRRKW